MSECLWEELQFPGRSRGRLTQWRHSPGPYTQPLSTVLRGAACDQNDTWQAEKKKKRGALVWCVEPKSKRPVTRCAHAAPTPWALVAVYSRKKKPPTKMRLNCWDVLYRALIQPIILCALIQRRHIIRRPAFPLKMSKNYTETQLALWLLWILLCLPAFSRIHNSAEPMGGITPIFFLICIKP